MQYATRPTQITLVLVYYRNMIRRWGCQYLSLVHRHKGITTCPFIRKGDIKGRPVPRTLHNKRTTLTEEQLRNKDYIIKYNNDMYMIGDHTNPKNPSGIAQYLNCAMKSSGRRNNCKRVNVIINKEKIVAAKITVRSLKLVSNYLRRMAED